MAEDIVDRLKAEGQLTRNTGTNSIRTVKIQLEKFEDVFSAISDNIARQTEMMAKSLDIQLDNFRISQETKEREQTKEQIDELETDQENTPTKKAEKEKESKDGPGLFSLLGGIGLKKLLLGGALIVGGLFTAYNLAKGFVDELTDGGWTRFEEGLVDFVASIDFESLKTAFDDILAGLLDIVGTISALKVALLGLSGAIGLATLAVRALQLRNLLRGEAPRATPGTTPRATPRATPGTTPRATPGTTPRATPPRDPTTGRFVSPNAAPGGGIFSRLLNNPVARFATRWAGPVGFALLANDFIQLGLRGPASEEEMQRLRESGDFDTFMEDWMQTPESSPDVEERQITPLEEASERLRSLIEERERMVEAARENAATSSIPFNDSDEAAITKTIDRDIAAVREELENLVEELPEYKRGTKGFQDFGDASFAILHGREAVVPQETPAGRFLEQYFDENWSPKVSPMSNAAERVAAAASGASAMIVVNNSPVISPVTNNVQGAPSVSTSNFFGSGGGSNVNPYGLPSAIS